MKFFFSCRFTFMLSFLVGFFWLTVHFSLPLSLVSHPHASHSHESPGCRLSPQSSSLARPPPASGFAVVSWFSLCRSDSHDERSPSRQLPRRLSPQSSSGSHVRLRQAPPGFGFCFSTFYLHQAWSMFLYFCFMFNQLASSLDLMVNQLLVLCWKPL